MFNPVNPSPLFRLPSACPFVTDAEPIVLTTNIRTIAHQLIDDVYTCKYSIEQRDGLPPIIRYLIEQLQLQTNPADPQVVYLIAVMQIIYICLTQLHFHFDCPCLATFRDQPYKPHNFYDHLYQLILAINPILTPYFVPHLANPQDSESLRLWFLFSHAGATATPLSQNITYQTFSIDALSTSIMMSLVPLTVPVKSESYLRWNGIVEYLMKNKLLLVQKQGSLYVRYVNYAYSEDLRHVVGLFPFRDEPKCLNNFDLSGCWSRRAYLTQSMLNCDLRDSTWLTPSLNEDFLKSPIALPSAHPPGESIPPSFSIFKNNSCFFEFELQSSQIPPVPIQKHASWRKSRWLSCFGVKS